MKNCLKVAILALAMFVFSACDSVSSGVNLNVDGGAILGSVNISYTKSADGTYNFVSNHTPGRVKYSWDFGGRVYQPLQYKEKDPVVSYVDDGDYSVQLTVEIDGITYQSNVIEITNYQPVRVFTNYSTLSGGQNNTGWKYFVSAISNKKLYNWGTGFDKSTTATYFNIDNQTVKDVAQTHDTIVVLTYSGKVYTYGYNMYGTLGDGTNTMRKEFKPVEALQDVVVKRIYTNDNSVYAIDADGKVWSWGRNHKGQLGIGNKNNNFVPTMIEGFDNKSVKELAVGEWSVLALTKDGQVYSWGDNTDAQLGIDNYTAMTSPVRISAFADKVIVGVSIRGDDFTSGILTFTAFAIDRDGKIYGWGAAHRGLLGNPAPANTKVPSIIEGMQDKVVVSIEQANIGTIWAIDDKGHVYSWGTNNAGMLGRGVLIGVDDPTPKVLNYFSDKGIFIKKVLAGKTTSIFAYDSEGNAYAWGSNGRGQLGTGEAYSTMHNTPVLIDSLSGNKIVSMTNGRYITFAVSDTGKVFGAGENYYYMGIGNGSLDYVNQFLHINTLPALP